VRGLKIAGYTVAALVLLYGFLTAGVYVAMRQPPERFGAIMSHVPMPAMMVLPFRPLWMSARAGRLQPGDAAPDFALPSADHSRIVKLSEELRERPVVLIFGSYT
jgi:hypothetical protein